MPFSDPTSTAQDLLIKAVHSGNEVVLSAARAATDVVDPFRLQLYPPIAAELLPDLTELVSGWIGVAERLLAEEKQLLLSLTGLIQPLLQPAVSSESISSSKRSSNAKAPVAA